MAWRKVVIRRTAVVRVCSSEWAQYPGLLCTPHTLNRRGGIIGERFVITSLIPAMTSNTPPMTSRAIVDARFPKLLRWAFGRQKQKTKNLHPFSLSLNPKRTQRIPAVIRNRPAKSNSAICSRSVLPRRGFKLRKKKRTRPPTPPVGLWCKVSKIVLRGGVTNIQIDEETPTPADVVR